jgi:hypothetical protein
MAAVMVTCLHYLHEQMQQPLVKCELQWCVMVAHLFALPA